MTVLSVEDIRHACGIEETDKVLPAHFYDDQPTDKWGNPILPNGERMQGELFDDPSVQKILEKGEVLCKFRKYVKYPRTWHLPWSPGATKDDRIIKNTDIFEGKIVVVTIKLDGENTTMYNDYIHARSRADKKHWSKSWIKNFHSQICCDIGENDRLVIENLYAKHSIKYIDLESYCYGLSIWTGLRCWSWSDTQEMFTLLNIPTPKVLYHGVFDENKIKEFFKPFDMHEGYVVRLEDSFHYKDFAQSVAKYVRKDHVTSNEHWFHGNCGEINNLKSGSKFFIEKGKSNG
jgi:hypothetical protein